MNQAPTRLLTRPDGGGIAEWNEWRDANFATTVRSAPIDLRHLELERVDLTGANLDRTNLAGANLFGTNLTGAGLSESNLVGTNLREANLAGAHLQSADLRGANLTESDLSAANLAVANARYALLDSANLAGTRLFRTDLTGANLLDATADGANLHAANLIWAKTRGMTLPGAELSGVIGISHPDVIPASAVGTQGPYVAYRDPSTQAVTVWIANDKFDSIDACRRHIATGYESRKAECQAWLDWAVAHFA